MRFVLVTGDGHGNLRPQLTLLDGLTAAGHAVTVVAGPGVAPVFADRGRTVPPAPAPPPPSASTGVGGADPAARRVTGPPSAADLLAAVAETGADRILVDGMLLGALAAAESTGLPTAALWPGLFGAFVDGPAVGALDRATAALNTVRASHGLAALGRAVDQLRSPDWLIAFTYPALDLPPAGSWPNLVYVGSAPVDVGFARPRPPGGPLVVVAFERPGPVAPTVLAALRPLPVRVAVATPGPPGRSVPEEGGGQEGLARQLVGRASLVITDGSHDITAAAVRAGVPVLAVTHAGGPATDPVRTEASGAGLRLPADVDPVAVATAVVGLLADADVPARAAELATAVAAGPVDGTLAVEVVCGAVPDRRG